MGDASMNESVDKQGAVLLEDMLSAWLKAGFEKAFSGTGQSFEGIAAVATSSPEFGDYQCNAAMGLAKALKKAPFDIARTAVGAFAPHAAVEKAEVVKPGFINLHLRADWLAGRVEEMAGDGKLCVPELGKGRTVVIDYSSPNVAKPMHIGHIRSTIIGNSIDRMHRYLGYRVISDNHIGDWGTQFGILIMGYRNFVDRDALARAPIEELERVYVKSYEQTKADKSWLDSCRHELVKLQSGDADNLALWREFVRLSLDEFARIYERLGVSFDHVRGESHYSDKLKGVVELLEKKGLAVPSEGATVVFLEEEKLPPAIVRKSDGAFNYTTSDVATVLARVEEFGPERIVYVTDERQQLHFRQIFALCRRLGVSSGLEHVWFGLMRLPEGTFSTREGNVIRLERLLDEAESRALKIVEESSPGLTPAQRKEIARAVGIGAVKYADLSQNPQTTVTFTWDKALALDGNSGPYLQYACARIASVRDKYVERFPGGNPDASPIRFTEPVERLLALKLARFPEILARAARGYKPSVLTDYLYDLAQAYSTFYQNVPFLKAPDGVRESRVRLCGVVAQVLGTGLHLLGIDTPPRI